jgi:quercetin dioxygenase-like cupin family protein
MRRVALLAALLCLAGSAAFAQDPVKVDPKHYTVAFENSQVRVLKIHYGPHEKSVMHKHPDSVVTFLSDSKVKFTTPDGKSEEQSGKAGDTKWTPAGTHLPENLSDTAMDAILVEMKSKPAAKPGAKAAPTTPVKK